MFSFAFIGAYFVEAPGNEGRGWTALLGALAFFTLAAIFWQMSLMAPA